MKSDNPQPGNARRRLRRWGGCAVLGLGALLIVRMVLSAAAWQREWVIPAVTSRGFIIHALVVLIGAGVLVGLLCWLAKAARTRGKQLQLDGQSGVAILEFVMVMPIALFLVLMMAQSALLLVGHMTVNYASYCAARSAIVIVPLDRTDVTGEPPNVLDMDAHHDYTAKHDAIRQAAIWAVLPISSSSRRLADGGSDVLEKGLQEIFDTYGRGQVPRWMFRLLERKLTYADEYTEVWLDEPANGSGFYGDGEVLVTYVRHTFYLSIPYAGRLYSLLDSFHGVELGFGPGEYGMEITASCGLTNEGGRDVIELERFPYNRDEFERLPWYQEWYRDWDW